MGVLILFLTENTHIKHKREKTMSNFDRNYNKMLIFFYHYIILFIKEKYLYMGKN